jgi:CelD/BcsL family acetyltransferase involved in cellulose biosynthesis
VITARGESRSAALRVELFTSLPDLARLEADWEELAATTAACTPAGPLWCLPWLAHLGSGRPLVVAAFAGDSLVALAPLHERRLAGLRVVRFLGHGLGAVSEMLVAPGHEDAAAACWARVLHDGPRYLQLVEYRAGGGGLDALVRSGARAVVRDRDACPVVRLAGHTAESLLASRPKGLQRTLRRARERLAEADRRHHVEVVREPDRLAAVLPEVGAVYDGAERHLPRQHLLAPPWSAFTTSLLSGAAERGRLRLFLGRIDGRPASFDVGLLTGRRLELWVGRYHPAYAGLSPGHLSMASIVEHAVEEGLAEIDMGLGDNPYKRRWADDRYRTLEATAASSPAASRLGEGILTARRHVRGVASRRPAAARSSPATSAGP